MDFPPIIDVPQKQERFAVVEKTFITDEGYYGVCLFTQLGHRCGYVGVTPDHGLYEKDIDDDLNIDVHGGVTFEGVLRYAEGYDLWFIGFDCGHFSDRMDSETATRYGIGLHDPFPEPLSPIGEIRDLDYVVNEVKKLSSQLLPHAIMEALMSNQKGE